MFIILLILIFIRPFISSLAFPAFNYLHSVLLLTFLIFWFMHKGAGLENIRCLRYPIALFCLSLLISISFSGNRINSCAELYKYCCGLSLFIIAASLKGKGRDYLILTICLSALIISFLAVYQYLFGFKFLLNYITKRAISEPFVLDYIERKRVFAPFVTPNALGGYLAMAIPLCLAHKRTRLFIIPLSIALMLTKSIGALFVLYLGLTLYFYLAGRIGKKEIFLLFGILIIIGLIYTLRASPQKEHAQPLFSTFARLSYWNDTLKIIRRFPLLGVGLGNFNLAQSRYAHNSYLQIWAETGILGIISFFWINLAILKIGLNRLKELPEKIQVAGLVSANIVFLTHNFLDFTFFLPEIALLWWLVTGCLLLSRQQ